MSSRRKQTTLRTNKRRYSKYHPNEACTECALCGRTITAASHFDGWSTLEKRFLTKHLGMELLPSTCICKSHHTEAKRHCSQPNYIPKWKQGVKSDERVLACSHPQCSTTATDDHLIVPAFTSMDTMKVALSIDTDRPEQLLLCPKHYTQLHKELACPKSCGNCGMKPKRGAQFTRHCPDTKTINLLLFENTGSDRCLTDSDILCLNCYKSHLAILSSIGETMTPNELLESEITTWEHQLSHTTNMTQLTKATLTTVVHVAKVILSQHALLLPQASDVFLETYQGSGASVSDDIHLEVGEGIIKYTSHWLLNQLVLHLHHHMSYKCIHKKYGTILYRKGGDTLISLSWALGRHRLDNKDDFPLTSKPYHHQSNHEQLLAEAGQIINDLIHVEIE